MLSSRGAKPLVSILLALLLVLAFVVPFLQYNFLAGPLTPFDKVQAGSIRYGVIIALALLWLGTSRPDSILRWNTCARIIMKHDLKVPEEEYEPVFQE